MKLVKRKKEKGNTNGFTLIELIVVIAIIGLLASIISASLADSKVKSQNAATMQQVSEYQKAISLYIINNQNKYPDTNDTSAHCIGSGSDDCLWVEAVIETESSGALTDIEPYIQGLPFVSTPTVAGFGQYKGLIYICNDINCTTANFYWPEKNVTSCTKGTTYFSNPALNGVVCTQIAEEGD